MASPFQIARLTLDTVTWTAVTVPFACNQIAIKNADTVNAMKVRTDSAAAAIATPTTLDLHVPFYVGLTCVMTGNVNVTFVYE